MNSRIMLGNRLVGWVAVTLVLGGCARSLPPAQRVQTTNVSNLRASFGGGTSGAAAASAATLEEPTGWATLKGSFRIEGTPPQPVSLNDQINRHQDRAVCAPGGRPVLSEELVVDSATGGIRDVVIYLTGPAKFPVGDPKWEHESYAASREAALEFDQKNCIFLTHLQVMRSTQTLRILNSDAVSHNTKLDAPPGTQQINEMIPAGSNVAYQPKKESQEPFSVSCSVHPWMLARMLVRDSPYYAVTKADGTFEIANVPAGVPLEFRVWQEKAKFLQDVKVDGSPQRWQKGRVKMKLQPGEEKNLAVVVEAGVFAK
jgi:hypothetical protein